MNKPIAAAGWSRTLFYALQFTWGLPVNLVGLLLFLCCKGSRHEKFCNSIVTYLPGNFGGLSLGIFIFLGLQNADDRRLCVHENMDTRSSAFFSAPSTGLLSQFQAPSGITSLLVTGKSINYPMTRFIANAGPPHGVASGTEHKPIPSS